MQLLFISPENHKEIENSQKSTEIYRKVESFYTLKEKINETNPRKNLEIQKEKIETLREYRHISKWERKNWHKN